MNKIEKHQEICERLIKIYAAKNKHYEDVSEMPLELGTHILEISNVIIKLHKKIIGAEKVYLCTVCDGKRNNLHLLRLFRKFHIVQHHCLNRVLKNICFLMGYNV